MKMTEEEFNATYAGALDALLEVMAETAEIDPEKFYSMACILENLRFFSPVLYAALQNKEKP